MKIHFIAIGGSAMHNLALALHAQGHAISGSDDEVFEPSRSRLQAAGLLPETEGWDPARIHSGLDAVILGMHARADNPEMARAKELGIPLYSYPEFLYEQSKDKQRVVIGGSHGKTSITSMVMHLLAQSGRSFDYLVGAKLDGFDHSVLLDAANECIVIEGDEYLASPLDRRPKFHLYHPHIALISGIAWDHMNVFPTFDNYLDQFRIFIDKIVAGGLLIYCEADPEVKQLVESHPRVSAKEIRTQAYSTPKHRIENGKTYLALDEGEVALTIFGKHNLQNLEGARLVCRELGLTSEEFKKAAPSFRGASRRLELLHDDGDYIVFRDFAHAPSKLAASTAAVREQFPEKQLVACIELHTYSSLNKDFLQQYAGSMNAADRAFVFFSPEVLQHKKLPALSKDEVKSAFDRADLEVFTSISELQARIDSIEKSKTVLLLMSSGNWQGGIQY